MEKDEFVEINNKSDFLIFDLAQNYALIIFFLSILFWSNTLKTTFNVIL